MNRTNILFICLNPFTMGTPSTKTTISHFSSSKCNANKKKHNSQCVSFAHSHRTVEHMKSEKLIKCTLLIKSNPKKSQFRWQNSNRYKLFQFISTLYSLRSNTDAEHDSERKLKCRARENSHRHTLTSGQLNSISAIYFRVRVLSEKLLAKCSFCVCLFVAIEREYFDYC